MSCAACELAQEPNKKSLTQLNGGTFVRVGAANVLIVGCQQHLEELIGRSLVMLKIPKGKP
jgi:hypothetical protein